MISTTIIGTTISLSGIEHATPTTSTTIAISTALAARNPLPRAQVVGAHRGPLSPPCFFPLYHGHDIVSLTWLTWLVWSARPSTPSTLDLPASSITRHPWTCHLHDASLCRISPMATPPSRARLERIGRRHGMSDDACCLQLINPYTVDIQSPLLSRGSNHY